MARRFKFSLRTLVALVTLICAYLACWEPTKRIAATTQRTEPVESASAALPLIIRQDEWVNDVDTNTMTFPTHYYLWVFGRKLKLPFKSEWEPWIGPGGIPTSRRWLE